HLLNHGRSFRWNLPRSEMQWVGEILWGVVIYLVSLFVAHQFRRGAAWIGLESHASPWRSVYENPRAALAFHLTDPISALYQEILFRVYAQTRLSRILGRWSACSVLIGAGLYAASHDSAQARVAMFGVGLVFGTAYQVSRKVPRLVFAHWFALIPW